MSKSAKKKKLSTVSISARFLIAPVIAIFLSIILYFSSDQIIQSHSKLFKKLSDSNLVQISEISQITILITENNNGVVSLLFESESLDETQVYEQGKNHIHEILEIEKRLLSTLGENKSLLINGKDIFAKIKSAFSSYRSEIISAIEMTSVDRKQASYELILANNKLSNLTHCFLKLSEYYTSELTKQAAKVEGTLYKKTYITELAIILISIMLWATYYFSRSTSKALTKVYSALIALSKGDTSITIEVNNDAYINRIWRAVSDFKESIITSEAYKNELLIQKFAMDQHSMISITNIKGKITYVNDKFCNVSGYSKEELIGANHRIVNSNNQPKEYWRNMYLTVSNGNVWQDEVLNKSKDGSYYWDETSIIPMTSVHDKNVITGYIGIRTDITEKKNQHKKLIEAKAVAESAVLAKSQFLASMSHEIRTPMNGVLGMLDLLMNNELNEEQYKRAEVAYTSAKSLLTLIDDILDFSKIDANKLELELIEFNIRSMLEEFTECMLFQAQEKGLTLELDCSTIEEATVLGDPGRLRQILTNIVGNAIKFTDTGSVSILAKLTHKDEKHWMFSCSITDTGIGIAEDKIPSLFNSFSQVDISTTRKYGGSGLGLAISKRLAELMWGDITVTSEEGKGSCFTCNVNLGISDKKLLKPTVIETDVQSPLVEIPTWPDNARVLVVEDNRVNQLVAKGILKRFNLNCDIANNGLEAIEMLEQQAVHPYSIVLMDCQMPELDGYAATHEIRMHDQGYFNKDIPIIAMTANAMKGDREKCISAGMNDYLSKPIDADLLLEKLVVWLT